MATRRIYMIGGTGNIGKLVAHSLRDLPDPPPVTLFVHTKSLLDRWKKSQKSITLQKDGKELQSSGYDVELTPEAGDRDNGSFSKEPIHNLFVVTKAAFTVPHLSRVAHRLNADSTICFLQNGMGIVEEVNEKIFPDPKTRPNYMQGIVTHGMNTPAEIRAGDPFYAVHGGSGAIHVALLPRQPLSLDETQTQAKDKLMHEDTWPKSAQYILQIMTKSEILAAVGITRTELIQQQLQKLAVNSVVNPLTSLLDCPNGSLLNNDALMATIRMLLKETHQVFVKLPELRGIPDIKNRLSVARLEEAVTQQCKGTTHNISSMLSDLRVGQVTEIAYINGYIVKRAKEVGLEAPANYLMMQTVIGKQQVMEQTMKSKEGNL